MPIVSKAEFARLARVTPSAVSEAIQAGLVVPTGRERRSGIDTTLDCNAAYLRYPAHQRHDGAWRKRLREARAERDARAKLEQLMQMEPSYSRAESLARFFWERGRGFPEGWSHLDVADVFEPDGRRVPLIFYSASAEEGDLGVTTEALDIYRVDPSLETPFAVDAEGKRHDLILTMHGKVPWLENITGPANAAALEAIRSETVGPRAEPAPGKRTRNMKSKSAGGGPSTQGGQKK